MKYIIPFTATFKKRKTFSFKDCTLIWVKNEEYRNFGWEMNLAETNAWLFIANE